MITDRFSGNVYSAGYAIRAVMNLDLANLPDDADKLKEMVASFRLDLEKSQEQIHYLEERIRLLQNELFDRKSEKRSCEDNRQLLIIEQNHGDQGVLETAVDDTIDLPAHKRRKRGRKPLLENLPRVEVIHDLYRRRKGVCLRCAVKPHRARHM